MYNSITLVGRWTKDTEITMSSKGTEIMRCSLAVGDNYNKDHTDFIDVTAFGKLAINTNEFTGKGSKVLVSGKLRQERWEKDGQKRSKHVVIANQIVFLESKGSGQPNQQAPQKQQPKQNNPFQGQGEPVNIDSSDLPF